MNVRQFENAMLAVFGTGLLTFFVGMALAFKTPSPPHVDRVDHEIDATIGSLASTTIVTARREGSETVLVLSDGRTVVVRGYKGHHFYERKPR